MIDLALQRYAFYALAAAALFGVSTPLAKWLLGAVSPVVLAGLLYLGSGLALGAYAVGRRSVSRRKPASEPRLAGRDWAWLAGAVLTGGAVAPVLLMWGLSGTTAGAASLLLNTEGVLTILLAGALFREAIGRRVAGAALIMLCAGVLLAWSNDAALGFSWHALAIAGACLGWALDNNFTRNIAAADPVVVAMTKGLAAGSVNLALGLATGGAVPALAPFAVALAVGALSYGVSLVLFIVALRHLGAARTAAHFGTAPFIGAVAAVIVLGEPVTAQLAAAFAMMAAATWLVLTERHGHTHTHERLVHSHRHVHDEHHRHSHDGSEGVEPHTHSHAHEPMTHAHAHLPDIHHRHEH